MLLIDKDKRFELKLVGNEFKNSTSYHDSNWLKVQVDVNDGDTNWVAEDNCLLSYELERLRDWVSGVYESTEDEIRFTENELAFRFDRDESILTVVLDFYLHPSGKQYRYEDGGDCEYLLSFNMNKRKMDAFLSDIVQWISLFPVKNIENKGK